MQQDDDTTHTLTDDEAFYCWTIAACAFRMSGAPPIQFSDTAAAPTPRTDITYTEAIIAAATHLPRPSSDTHLSAADCALLKVSLFNIYVYKGIWR